MPDMSEMNFFPEGHGNNNDPMTLEELVALIQQAPEELFESSAQKTERATQQLKEAHQHLHDYHANNNPAGLKQAITSYRHALDMDPTLSEGYIGLAKALWAEGEISLENALYYYELAIEHEPNNPYHYLATADFLTQNNEIEHLHRVYNLALRAAKPHQQYPVHQKRFKHQLRLVTQQPFNNTFIEVAKTVAIAGEMVSSLTQYKHDHDTIDEPAFNVKRKKASSKRKAGKAPSKSTEKQEKPASSNETKGISSGLVGLLGNIATVIPHKHWQQKAVSWLYQQAPQQRGLLEHIAKQHLADGKVEEAISCYELMAQQYPNDATNHALLGQLYTFTNQINKARHQYEQALAIKPSNFEWLYQLGQLQTDCQEYLPSLMSFKEALKQRPHHPMVLSNMAYTLFKLDDIDGAINCYQQALDDRHGIAQRRSQSDIDEAINDEWRSAVAQTLGALLYQYTEETDDALDTLKMAVRIDETNSDARTMLAELFFEMGDFDGALTHYDWLAQHSPSADTHSHRGYILWQMDQNEDAITAYQKALEYDEGNAVVMNNLGVVYLDEMFDSDSSVKLFKQALEAQPQYTLAAFNLGRAYELAGKRNKAINAYGEAIKLHEFNPEMDKVDIEERLHRLFDV